MLIAAPFILLFIALLVAADVFGGKLLKKLPDRGQLKVLSVIGILSEALLLVLAIV